MLQLALSALLFFMAVGCGGPRYIDYFPYHDDGTVKPKVALMPILDSSNNQLPWNIAEEIWEGIYAELMDSGEFYVVSPEEIGPCSAQRKPIDFFSNQEPFFSNAFNNTDFIVGMEITERSIEVCDPCTLAVKHSLDSHPSNLKMTVRLRIKILDIRFCEPKIILYEVFSTCYTATQSQVYLDLDEAICWKDEAYSKSYCGIGHRRLIRELTKRLEEVIGSAN